MRGLHTIIFIGSQGSGKGTQARRLKEYMEKEGHDTQTFLFSMGEGFRAFAKNEGLTQRLVGERLSRGEMLPVFLPIWLWTRLFIENVRGQEHIIFDGSPRTGFEAEVLDTAFEFYDRKQVTVLRLDVSRGEIMRRLTSRGREDDTEEAIQERLSWYEDHINPALEFFKSNPRYEVVSINGEQDADGVFEEILAKLFNS